MSSVTCTFRNFNNECFCDAEMNPVLVFRLNSQACAGAPQTILLNDDKKQQQLTFLLQESFLSPKTNRQFQQDKYIILYCNVIISTTDSSYTDCPDPDVAISKNINSGTLVLRIRSNKSQNVFNGLREHQHLDWDHTEHSPTGCIQFNFSKWPSHVEVVRVPSKLPSLIDKINRTDEMVKTHIRTTCDNRVLHGCIANSRSRGVSWGKTTVPLSACVARVVTHWNKENLSQLGNNTIVQIALYFELQFRQTLYRNGDDFDRFCEMLETVFVYDKLTQKYTLRENASNDNTHELCEVLGQSIAWKTVTIRYSNDAYHTDVNGEEPSNQHKVKWFEDFSGDVNLQHQNSSDDCETLALDIILVFSLLRVLSTVLNEQLIMVS
jgi:hypothetical protein